MLDTFYHNKKKYKKKINLQYLFKLSLSSLHLEKLNPVLV